MTHTATMGEASATLTSPLPLTTICGEHVDDDEKAARRRESKRLWAEKKRRENGVKPVELAPCGTTSAYRRHHRLSEDIDEPCRLAWNAQNRERYAAKKAREKAEAEALAAAEDDTDTEPAADTPRGTDESPT